MKAFLQHRSKRWNYDGWALRVRGAKCPLPWTVSTTREEARELRRESRDRFEDLFSRLEVVKVKLSVEVVGDA